MKLKRLLASVLALQILYAAVAGSVDLHLSDLAQPHESSLFCADCQPEHCPADDPDGSSEPAHRHSDSCCFGALLMASPPAPAAAPGFTGCAQPRLDFCSDLILSWQTAGPERPPRI